MAASIHYPEIDPHHRLPDRFARTAWIVLAYNVLVVLWGAYVRVTGSGAGCGSHWPLCNGQVIPRAPQVATVIEFTHRVMSGVALAGVVFLWFRSRQLFRRGAPVRTAATLSLVFLIAEALLGAGLVLFEYVARNASAGRAIYLSLHLANTQVLLAALALTAWLARHELPRRIPRSLGIALPVAIFVSITGAIAALGDTLFPAASVAEGMRQEFSAAAHFLVRLRVLHPLIAFAGGGYIALAAIRRRGFIVVALVIVQLCAGALNLALLAPAWMQILHLLLADLVWIALVVLALQPDRI